MPSHAGDPHQTYGIAEWRHVHYDVAREPTFPRKPDLSKGELASGANLTRTDVWHDPKEPAITSIAKFSPENFRPKGWAENAPMPTTTCPEGTLDFRANRLPIGHADRRPFLYFLAASTGFVMTSVLRITIVKLVHTLWPAKDVFAAGIVEVDIRPVQEGQNFVVKWRSKPVFVRRRTPDMIAAPRRTTSSWLACETLRPMRIGARIQSGSSASACARTLDASLSQMQAIGVATSALATVLTMTTLAASARVQRLRTWRSHLTRSSTSSL